jgi:hypothetical protein
VEINNKNTLLISFLSTTTTKEEREFFSLVINHLFKKEKEYKPTIIIYLQLYSSFDVNITTTINQSLHFTQTLREKNSSSATKQF